MKPHLILAVLLFSPFGMLHGAGSNPRIFSLSDPVRPDETVLFTGDGLGADAVMEISRADGGGSPGARKWTTVKPLKAGPQSLMAAVPADWPPGVYACRVRSGGGTSNELIANAPDPWWWNGDGGEFATPGGWLRVFGKCLNAGEPSTGRLRAGDGKRIDLKSEKSDGYALRFALPVDLATGDYKLLVHNGLAGDSAWAEAGTVLIRQPEPWKSDVFNVKDFGPDPGKALLEALKKAEANGGGVVFLPGGRYPLKDRIVIPPHTILRGESAELVSLFWPDYDTPPEFLITGVDFGVESLTLYCQNHRNVVGDGHGSQRMFLHHVRIRANSYFMIEAVGKDFHERHGPPSHLDAGAAILVKGRNFEITDCDIYATNYALRILKGKTGIVARNRLLYGGRGYSLENTERLIFEDNLVQGCGLLAMGCDITTFWSNYCKHIYYFNNRIQQIYGADREMMTTDAGGTHAYLGKITTASGAKLTLAADPQYKDYAPKAQIHTDWTGAAVQIIDGKGMGQYRFVASNAGREWRVDRPWIVPPDTTSRIAIAPFRGRNLFIGNSYEDGGAFQLYGAGHDTIIANNRGTRMDGFVVLGLGQRMPTWGCQVLDNEILEGNSYGGRRANLRTVSIEGSSVRANVFRRNNLRNNSALVVGAGTEDTLIENNKVSRADIAIIIKPGAKGTLLRGNTFDHVAQPVQEDSK